MHYIELLKKYQKTKDCNEFINLLVERFLTKKIQRNHDLGKSVLKNRIAPIKNFNFQGQTVSSFNKKNKNEESNSQQKMKNRLPFLNTIDSNLYPF